MLTVVHWKPAVKSPGPKGNPVSSKLVTAASPSTTPRSVAPNGRTRKALAPAPRYRAVFPPGSVIEM
jgi:hypothetical protein